MSSHRKRGGVLVGHGGVPKDFPREQLTKLKSLEAKRRASGVPPTAEEIELETRIRRWPRTPQTNPYQAGLEALARHLKISLNGDLFAIGIRDMALPSRNAA